MGNLWRTLNQPIPEMIARTRFGPAIMGLSYLALGVWLNFCFLYALLTGKILARAGRWIEARESLPMGYWIYVAGFGAAALALDGWILWSLWSARKSRIG